MGLLFLRFIFKIITLIFLSIIVGFWGFGVLGFWGVKGGSRVFKGV